MSDDDAVPGGTGPVDEFRELAELLFEDETLASSLQRVADTAVRGVDACDGCGLSLLERGAVRTRTAAGDFAKAVDDTQYGTGEGPCLSAIETGEIVAVDDFATETRWPKFFRAAAVHGVRSSYSVPLRVRGDIVGSINFYGLRGPFGPLDRRSAEVIANQAAVALANAQAVEDSRELTDQLHQALESRDLIGQAKGILMERLGCDADAAFERLREVSQQRNVKLRVVAEEIVRNLQPPAE